MEVPIPLTNPNYHPPGALVGLGSTTTPAKARKAVNDGLVAGFTYGQIKQNLRMVALHVFIHQKLSPRYQHRVRDGANTLILFLCAVHGQQAPGNDEALPTISEDRALPLCHWETLYLALVAEIRAVYSDIIQNLKSELQNGELVLHTRGFDGKEEHKPFTAFDLGSQLEEMWDLITDVRLLGPLENAVRMGTIAEQYRAEFGNLTFRQRFENDFHKFDPKDVDARLDTTQGIIDTNAYTSDEIIDMLWQKYAGLVSRACRERFHIEVDLAARRARLHESTTNPTQSAQEEDKIQPFCVCDEHCHCRVACQFEVGICACKNQHLVDAAYYARNNQAPSTFVPTEPRPLAQPYGLFGGVTDSMSKLQLAPSSGPEPESVEAYKIASRTARSRTTQSFVSRRERSDTESSNLVYVPSSVPRTPTRGKNNIPLGMLGDESRQRYPNFRKTSTDFPDFGSSNYTTDMPQRKAVPFQSASGLSPSKRSKTTSPEYTLTMLSRPDPDPRPAEHRPSKSFLPQFLRLKGRSSSTQTSPEPIVDPRKPDNEFERWDTSHVKTPKISAQRKTGEASARHPSPMGRHSADSPVWANRSPAPTAITRANTADSSQLALPAFLNPRPAQKQRYVSAGGDARLQDREEITDFVLPPAADPGFSMTKEEFDNRVAEGEFVTPPRASMCSSNSRVSQENAIGSSGSGSGRTSYDTVNNQGNTEKRDRTTSNTSTRAFKRIFSRAHSSSE